MHRLPVYETSLAAALRVSAGYTLEPKAYRDNATGTETCPWFISAGAGPAGTTLEAWRLGTLPPEDPFCTAMYGIEALVTLLPWLRQPATAVRCQTLGSRIRFCQEPGPDARASIGGLRSFQEIKLLPADRIAQYDAAMASQALEPAAGVPIIGRGIMPLLPHHFAAAAIVCGCLPVEITGEAGAPRLLLTAQSVTLPGLTIEAMSAHALQPAATLPGPVFEPGEHPFFYALEAVRTYIGLRWAETRAALNPVHFYKAKQRRNPHTAYVSEALLRSKDTRFRDATRTHLATA